MMELDITHGILMEVFYPRMDQSRSRFNPMTKGNEDHFLFYQDAIRLAVECQTAEAIPRSTCPFEQLIVMETNTFPGLVAD
jgi:hypothetical protein